MDRTGWITIDTIGKLHACRHTLFAFCGDCANLYRKDRTPHNPPSSWTVDITALIAERGADSPLIRMAPVPCPYCGGRRVEFRVAGPGPHGSAVPALHHRDTLPTREGFRVAVAVD
jgi:hypothetical protein